MLRDLMNDPGNDAPGAPRAADVLADGALVERAQAGDERAFGELVHRYEGKIFALVRRILRDDDEAEDALQETFLSAYRGLPSFKREAKFSTWLFRIATNAALMRLRKRRPDVVSLDRPLDGEGDGDSHAIDIPDWSRQPDEELIDDETRRAMDEAIAALPAELSTVFLLRDVEEMSNAEAAEALGLSLAAAKSRLHRARLFLRDRLNRHFADRPMERGKGRANGPTATPSA